MYILFDSEEQAQKQADSLAILLNGRGVETYVLELESGDPAEMNEVEAANLMQEI